MVEDPVPMSDDELRRCNRSLLLQAASLIGQQLLDYETRERRAPEDWTSREVVDFYGGPLGEALFWTGMALCLPEKHGTFAEQSLCALEATRARLRDWLEEPRNLDATDMLVGGLSGLAGALYVLTCVGALLKKPELLREALAASILVTPERIQRDRRFDVVGGGAGTILALFALRSSLSDVGASCPETDGLLAQARCCAEHLLGNRSLVEPRAWIPQDAGRPYCGFAHGAAGLLYSLLRVYQQTRDPRLLEAAQEAMAFERSLYSSRFGNWAPYPGYPETGAPMISWCWGAPGIALARTAALEILDDVEVREDIRLGVEATLNARPTLEDHVCCGNMGRAQILAFIAGRLAGTGVIPDLARISLTADRLVYNVLRYAKGRGGFGWSDRPREAVFQPSFFKGAAGVGYAFLYLASAGDLPLPLVLEPPRSAGV